MTSRTRRYWHWSLFRFGVFATGVTPREEEPQIDVTMADVMVAFPGASAKDVEKPAARPGRAGVVAHAWRRAAFKLMSSWRHHHRAVRCRRHHNDAVLRLC
ncbi:MAG: efflux RND transporter permease subunit [Betaproteobacteria bacterium]|nr:efflux RND transporter permease subunit [Betaproteobacteria bacterium]